MYVSAIFIASVFPAPDSPVGVLACGSWSFVSVTRVRVMGLCFSDKSEGDGAFVSVT